jgi:hypothetical protein
VASIGITGKATGRVFLQRVNEASTRPRLTKP